MRWYSTLESSNAGEPSALAIVESLTVSAISLWIAWQWGTVQHIAIGACVAPLLLLRTDESQAMGIRWLKDWGNPVGRSLGGRVISVSSAIKAVCITTVGFPFLLFVIKVSATITAFLSHPVRAFQSIPVNWKRVNLTLDAMVVPEPLPGIETIGEEQLREISWGPTIRFRNMLNLASEMTYQMNDGSTLERRFAATMVLLFLIVFAALIYLPALTYRWSLKASSLIYAPLLYVVDEARKDEESPEGRLKYHGRSVFSRILAVYSIFVVIAFCVKWYLLVHWNGFATWWNGSPFWQTLGTLVEPKFFTWWQIAQLINAALALSVFIYSWGTLQRLDAGLKVDLSSANQNLSILFFIRAVLTIYILFCIMYLTINGWQGFIYPPIERGLLPSW